MRTADSNAEFSWNGLTPEEGETAIDPLRQMISGESLELRRALALKYGCGLSIRRIGRIMGMEPRRIQTALTRFEARARRKLEGRERRRCESMILHAVRTDFSLPSPLAPDMGNVFRTFEADAAAMTRPSRLPARIFQAILAVILALVCMVGFWLAAVLMQQPVLEEPVKIIEVDNQSNE